MTDEKGLCVETARGFRVDPAGNILSAYGMIWLLNNDVHERGFVIKLEFDSSIVCL